MSSTTEEGRPDPGRPFASTAGSSDAASTAGSSRAASSTPRLSAHGLVAGYQTGRRRLELTPPLELVLRGGQLVCLLGPNGAGKSTLLRTLAGVHPALAGRVELDGQSIGQWPPRQKARRLAVVLTDGGPPLGMRGLELVRLGRQPHSPWSGRLRERDHDAVRRAIEAVDGAELAPRLLAHLSDGERQKLLLARALAQEADILVLDEITAFLDVPRRLEIFRILRRLAHDEGKAVLLTTHDVDLALRSADRVWLLSAEGLVTGSPESLVLDGSLGRAFAGRGIEFDRATGRFHLPLRRRGRVRLRGGGLEAEWTAHGLERLGFDVDGPTAGAADSVQAESREGEPSLVVSVLERGFCLELPGAPPRAFERIDELFDAMLEGPGSARTADDRLAGPAR